MYKFKSVIWSFDMFSGNGCICSGLYVNNNEKRAVGIPGQRERARNSTTSLAVYRHAVCL